MQQRADELVGELVERGSFDLVADLAQRFVTQLVGELIGLDRERLARFGPAGPTFFDSTGPEGDLTYEAVPVALELLQDIGSLTKADMVPGSMGWSMFEAEERGEIRKGNAEVRAWSLMGMAVLLGQRYGIWDVATPLDDVIGPAVDLIGRGIQP